MRTGPFGFLLPSYGRYGMIEISNFPFFYKVRKGGFFMLTYPMEERGGLPLYEYLYRRIRADILSGALAAGERLPSKRALAEHLHLSVITVEAAYQQLEAEGYVYTRPKRGFLSPALSARRRRKPLPRLCRRRRRHTGGWT